ncbi:major facilitator superfamily domain-containing protein [Parasitella parasitica]|nr:major facilitator superfamily domain-containing protein [Parasitella parasitica]
MDESTPLVATRAKKEMPSSWHAIFPMFLVAFSGGALFAPHVQFYTEVFCNIYYKTQNDIDNTIIPFKDCAIPPVQKMVSKAQAVIMFLTYASTLLGAGFYGRLSDRKGRSLILRISTIGSLIYVSCDILTAKYYDSIGIVLLFLGPLIRGMMAGESVLMAAVQAYIADCTSSDSRTVIFARLMASLFIGSAIGPFFSSLVLKHTGSVVHVFYIAFIVDVINVLYTTFLLPESNQFMDRNQHETRPNRKAIGVCSSLNIFSALQILFREPPIHLTRYALPCIALAEFLLTLVKRPPTLLYAMLKFKWTAYEGSLYYTCTSLLKLTMMIGVLPLLSRLFKKKCPKAHVTPADQEKIVNNSTLFDIWMVRIGIGMDAVCLALAGLASSVVLFTAAGMLQSVSMLAQPSIRGLLTTCVKQTQVGELLGAVAILDSIAMIISHLGINFIYSSSVLTMPNLTFFVCSAVASCSCLAAFMVKRKIVRIDEEDQVDSCLSAHYNDAESSALVCPVKHIKSNK